MSQELSFTLALPKGFLPPEAMRVLSKEAVARELPLVELIREALLEKSRKIEAALPQVGEEVAA